jgi:hypothetical protein
MRVTFAELDSWLSRTPVIAQVHPLVPLALRSGTKIVTNTQELLLDLESQNTHAEIPHLILADDPILSKRFPQLIAVDPPSVEGINSNIGFHLDYIRTHLLTTHKIASFIEQDVAAHPVDIVVLFLVDGLGYGDVLQWPGVIQPCFVDGPSVTYRFRDNDKTDLVETVGFASIINRPSVYERLYGLGYHHARGFTYWQPDNNVIADFMFAGLPFKQVNNFDTILLHLKNEQLIPQTYIQLVRQGLDGLAHGKRELHAGEIDMATQAILSDVDRLQAFLHHTGLRARIYLTADHGILWRKDLHPVQVIQAVKADHPRFSSYKPDGAIDGSWIRLENSFIPYYLFRFPYLGRQLPNNDSGVHGGLSYQESIVPFIKFEV